MNNLLRLCALSASLVWSTAAQADDVRTIPPGDDVIAAVKKGEPAPFDGQIFDINTALRWANWIAQYQDKIEADEMKAKSMCASELAYQQDISDADVHMLDKLNTDLRERLIRSERTRLQAEEDGSAWYKSVWFGVVLGAVTTSGVVYLGAKAF